ncbi:hypothetical protein MRX96_059864 [Rhipicephalus microplus]
MKCGHGKSVRIKPPKLPVLYFQILLCCAAESTVTQNTSPAIDTTGHRRLEHAVRLSTNAIYHAPENAHGTATASAPKMKTDRTGFLRAVGAEELRGHGKFVRMKPPKLPVLYFRILLCCAAESTVTQNTSPAIGTTDHRRLVHAVRLSTNANYHALAHAYGPATATATTMKTGRTDYLRAVGAENLRGHAKSVG